MHTLRHRLNLPSTLNVQPQVAQTLPFRTYIHTLHTHRLRKRWQIGELAVPWQALGIHAEFSATDWPAQVRLCLPRFGARVLSVYLARRFRSDHLCRTLWHNNVNLTDALRVRRPCICLPLRKEGRDRSRCVDKRLVSRTPAPSSHSSADNLMAAIAG